MKIYFHYYHLLIYLFIFCYSLVNCLDFAPISLPPVQYTITSCSAKCYFQANLYCTDSGGIPKPTITWDTGTNPTFISKSNSAQTALYTNLTTITNVGTYEIKFTYGITEYIISSTCKNTPTTITITPTASLKYNFIEDSYSTIVTITGLDKTMGPVKEFDLTCSGFIRCTLKYEKLNYVLKFYGLPPVYSSQWSYKVCLGSGTQKDFTIASPINVLNFNYSDISYYIPSNVAISKYSCPQYSFKVESNQNIPPYLLLANNAEGLPTTKPYPIQSINGISTYMGSFIYSQSYVNTTFTLNAQLSGSVSPIFNKQVYSNFPNRPSTTVVYSKPIKTSLISANNINLTMFTISFTENLNYGPFQLLFGLNYGYKRIMNTPYSIVSGNFNQLKFSISFLTFNSSSSLFQEKFNYNSYQLNLNNAKVSSNGPIILDVSTEKLFYNDDNIIIKIQFTSPNGLLFISTQRIINENKVLEEEFYYHQDLNIINGNYKSGTVEFLYKYKYVDNSTNETSLKDLMKLNIILYDLSLNSTRVTKGEYYSINLNNNKIFNFPTYYNSNYYFSISDIKNISFLYNNVDLTNNSGYNIMYLKLNGELPSSIKLTIKPQFEFIEIYGIYNKSILAYQFLFYLPSNIMAGYLSYSLNLPNSNLILNSQLIDLYQLHIVSNNTDLYGPIFKSIIKVPYEIGLSEIGWKVIIEDRINGYRDGYVIVSTSIDHKIYNISIIPQIKLYSFEFYIKIILPKDIISQDYIITQVALYDNQGINSTFYSNSYNDYYQFTNPFINYVNDDSNINIISVKGRDPVEDLASLPKIVDLLVSPNELVYGKDNNVVIKIQFDNTTLLKSKPIIYLTSSNFEIIECQTEKEDTSSLSSSSKFLCSTIISSGFGYPLGLGISIHNIYSLDGNVNGYSSDILNENKLQYHLPYGVLNQPMPVITKTSRFTSEGGIINIYGKLLDKCLSFQVLNSNYSNLNLTLNSPVYSSMVSISIFNNKETNNDIPFNYPFNITCIISSESPFITVYPINIQYYTTPVINSDSSNEELPTNEPKQCLKNCGTPTNGYCSSRGCICYSPWIGDDCLSQVIVVPPEVNNTTPIITFPNITEPNSNNNNTTNSTSSIGITKSLINIVELREIDVLGKIIKSYKLDMWIFKQITNNTYQYSTQIDSDGFLTTLSTTLEWFDRDTNLTFANQEVRLVKSSVKYTIDISYYNFKSKLNSLQLVMKASINSSLTDNVCSTKEYGQTVDNSDYIKLSIQNISIYGRFIKRAYVDSKIISISNVLLDDSMNEIQNKSFSSQTFIGINIPNYKSSIVIDPDFSILLDSDSKNNRGNKNSICSFSNENSENNNGIKEEKGLSKTKIAGIIIGAIGFTASIIFALSYSIYRKKQLQKQLAPINVKLSKI